MGSNACMARQAPAGHRPVASATRCRRRAWLSVELLGRLSGGLVRPLPVDIGRYRYRTGFVARRAAEDLAPFRALEQAVRDTALGRDDSPEGTE